MKIVMRLLVVFSIILLSVGLVSGAGLEEREILEGRVRMLMPRSFEPMSEERMKVKYPNENRPAVVLTNETGTVNIAFSHTGAPMKPKELDEARKAMDKAFHRMYPSAKWFRSEIADINERAWFVLELRTPALDSEIRNIMLGSSLDDRMFLISINMTEELEEEWLPDARRMMESIKITR